MIHTSFIVVYSYLTKENQMDKLVGVFTAVVCGLIALLFVFYFWLIMSAMYNFIT